MGCFVNCGVYQDNCFGWRKAIVVSLFAFFTCKAFWGAQVFFSLPEKGASLVKVRGKPLEYLDAQEFSRFLIHYPRGEGIVFGVPHVSIITEPVDLNQVVLYVDGKRILESAFAHCLICAGSSPAVLVARAPWTVTDGEHILEVEFKGEGGVVYRRALRYWVDTTTPTVMGISGLGVFPGGFVSVAGSTRVGIYGREHTRKVFIGANLGKSLPVEFAIFPFVTGGKKDELSFALKVQVLGEQEWGISVGAMRRAPFVVFGWRTQPTWVEAHIGVGSEELPSFWIGGSVRLSLLTQRLKGESAPSDLFAILDLVRLSIEADERGRAYWGIGVCHPYGWRASLQQVPMKGEAGWMFLVSYCFGFARSVR